MMYSTMQNHRDYTNKLSTALINNNSLLEQLRQQVETAALIPSDTLKSAIMDVLKVHPLFVL